MPDILNDMRDWRTQLATLRTALVTPPKPNIQCPYCQCTEAEATGEPDDDNQVEYRCPECGEYFVDDAQPSAHPPA